MAALKDVNRANAILAACYHYVGLVVRVCRALGSASRSSIRWRRATARESH